MVMPSPYSTQISGWGRYPAVDARQVRSEDLEAVTQQASLTRGLGRSYGDASLPSRGDRVVADSTLADRLLAFDSETGLLRAEAGLSLKQLNRVFLARGWFTPVSPGTQWVTLGGMVAADVHGKNHHVAGTFGEHVRTLRMRVADGRVLECSNDKDSDLFRGTLGGMGLTGHILEIEFRMQRVPSPWIWCESVRRPDFESVIASLLEAARAWPYTAAWIDCLTRGPSLGRGIVIKGRWATSAEAPAAAPRTKRPLAVPFQFPTRCLTRALVKGFNALY
jgi:decaprenylphospho-beta-D-ribofuranose 2-oxidase